MSNFLQKCDIFILYTHHVYTSWLSMRYSLQPRLHCIIIWRIPDLPEPGGVKTQTTGLCLVTNFFQKYAYSVSMWPINRNSIVSTNLGYLYLQTPIRTPSSLQSLPRSPQPFPSSHHPPPPLASLIPGSFAHFNHQSGSPQSPPYIRFPVPSAPSIAFLTLFLTALIPYIASLTPL